MKKAFIMALVMLLPIAASAQDWRSDGVGEFEYNCDLLDQLVAEFGEEVYFLREGKEYTVEETFSRLALGCGRASHLDKELARMEYDTVWEFTYKDGNSYQCELLREISARFGDQLFRLYNHPSFEPQASNLLKYNQRKAPYCVPRYIIANHDIQLRDCPDRSCRLNEYLLRGEMRPVVGIQADWYEVAPEFRSWWTVEPEDSTVFVHADDVLAGPADYIELDDWQDVIHDDDAPWCRLLVTREAANILGLVVNKAGTAREEIEVDIYSPFAESALPILDQIEKTFTDIDMLFISQTYRREDYGSRVGIYTIEIAWEEIVYRIGLDLRKMGGYAIRVYCNS